MAKGLTNGEYTVRYSDFDGVDLTGDGSAIDERKLAYAENMYKDYSRQGSGVIKSIPGYRRILALGKRINAIHSQNVGDGDEYLVVHAGDALYRFKKSERDSLGTLTPILTGLRDKKSHSFTKGGALFIIDGENIIRIKSDGTAARITQNDAYVPTTFKNGKPFEQRNLACKRFRETFEFGVVEKNYRRSDYLVFEVDEDGEGCILASTKATLGSEIYVPAYAKIGDKEYRVRAIADYAFAGRTALTSVHIADGVREIGRYAFLGCTSLLTVECSASTKTVSEGAFSGCVSLFELYLGMRPTLIGKGCFAGVDLSKTTVKFGQDADMVSGISGISELSGANFVYRAETPKECFAIPIMTPLEYVESVYISGAVLSTYSVSNKLSGSVPRYLYFIGRRSSAEGCEVVINGVCKAGEYSTYEEGEDFIARSGTDEGVISGCTVSASFDGRIFLAGNPKYPNTVFYSLGARYGNEDELYFGTLSHFDDGVATYPTVAIVPVKDTLAVFKSGDDGGGGIFCHEVKKESTFLERTYPVLNIHSGFGKSCGALSLFDEAVFLSAEGVYSLKRGTLGAALVTKRSSGITPLINSNTVSCATDLVSWQGYAVLKIGTDLLLADPRVGGNSNYGWYILRGIGSWENDTGVYRYSKAEENAFHTHSDIGKEVTGVVLSTVLMNGKKVYYTIADAKLYSVMPTGERRGGDFYPVSAMYSDSELLFFGTENGDVLLFNTDKRGEAPQRIKNSSDFDAAEYANDMGDDIHPDFYSFLGHAPRYMLVTKSDNCGTPHLSKSTARNSLAIKFGKGTGKVRVSVSEDGEGSLDLGTVTSGQFDFYDVDFSSLSFSTDKGFTVGVKDNSRAWCEKQISIVSEELYSILCVQSISYRYRVTGKIKRH